MIAINELWESVAFDVLVLLSFVPPLSEVHLEDPVGILFKLLFLPVGWGIEVEYGHWLEKALQILRHLREFHDSSF